MSSSTPSPIAVPSQEELVVARLRNDDRFIFYPFPDTGCPYLEGKKKKDRSSGDPKTDQEHHTDTSEEGPEALSLPLLYYLARDKNNKSMKAVKGDKTGLQLETETIPQNLWPAATPFAKWIIARPELFTGKHILELGSGVGLGGLAAASVGAASVTLTDISHISLAMMRLTVEKNRKEGLLRLPQQRQQLEEQLPSEDAEREMQEEQQQHHHQQPIFIEELSWGSEENYRENIRDKVLTKLVVGGKARKSFDLVIGCDVFYFNTSLIKGLATAKMALSEEELPNPEDKTEKEPEGSELRLEENGIGRKHFYCASVVRSERMDSDLEEIPSREGWKGGELFDADSREGLPEELRMFKWSL